MLHEVLHNVLQGLNNSNYSGVGRAGYFFILHCNIIGVVVERLDYTADAFSLCVSIAFDVRTKNIPDSKASELAVFYVESVLNGLQVI